MDHDPAKDIGLVKDGVVVQVARAPCEAAWFGGAPEGDLVDFPPGKVEAEMLWDGSVLSDPPAPPPVVTVPAAVSMRQARLALLAAGLLDTVQAYIDSAPKATQIEWQFATDVWRSRDLVTNIGGALGLTSDQIDALFVSAAAIP